MVVVGGGGGGGPCPPALQTSAECILHSRHFDLSRRGEEKNKKQTQVGRGRMHTLAKCPGNSDSEAPRPMARTCELFSPSPSPAVTCQSVTSEVSSYFVCAWVKCTPAD